MPGKAGGFGELRSAIERSAVKYPPRWPYTWGRIFRYLGFPADIIYRIAATHTIILGREHLEHLPSNVLFAGTHHSWADMSLVRWALARSGAWQFEKRLIVVAAADGFPRGFYPMYAALAFGIYPLRRHGEGGKALLELAEVARLGGTILIFPQGQHVRPEEERDGDRSVRFRRGVSRLARDLEAQIVPFGVAGTEDMMPPFLENFHGIRLGGVPVTFKRGPLAVAFGAPLALGPDEPLEEFTRRLQSVSYALTRQAEAALEQLKGGRG